MLYRQAIKYRRWVNSTPRTASLAGIVAWFQNTVKNQIPVGYQDENGFHFGVKRAEKESN
jgi:hypothetical protein